jgi:vacuolar-type H+-ATPase subunit H
MAETAAQTPQQIALQRLLQTDADAQSCLQQAHTQAMTILAEGEDAVQKLLAEARAAAEVEAKSQTELARSQVEAAAKQLLERTETDVAEMTRRAQEWLPDAVAFLCAWVKAEAYDDGPGRGGAL